MIHEGMGIQSGFASVGCLGDMVMEEITHLPRDEQAAILSGLIETLEATVARLKEKEATYGTMVEGGLIEQSG